jgi:hypothetical protein
MVAKSNDEIEIFLDLDGVIADFETHIATQNKRKPDGKIDWDALDYQWWSTMPAYTGAKAFYDHLKAIAPVKFLTGPVLIEDCYSGKAAWVKKFVPESGKFILSDLIICPSKEKHLLARPNNILIDDRENNIKDWEAAGGIGILHEGDFKQTLSKLQKVLAARGRDNTPPVSPPPFTPG